MIAAVAQGNCGSTFFEIVGLAAEDVEKNECKEDHFDREKQAGDANWEVFVCVVVGWFQVMSRSEEREDGLRERR